MRESRFCQNCGTKVDADEQFCHNCGAQLDNDVTDQTNQSSPSSVDNTVNDYQQPQSNNNSVSQQQPSNNGNVMETRSGFKKSKKHQTRNLIIGIVVAVVVVFGFIGYLFGNHYYSKSAVLDRAMTSLTSDKNTDSYFESTDSRVTLNDSTMAPLSKHMNKNNDELQSLKGQLSDSGSSKDGNFEYVQDGRKWLLFPNYQVKVKPVVPTITTSEKSADVILNNNKIGQTSDSDSDSEFSLGRILPGDYNITVSKTLSGKKVTNAQTTYLDNSDNIYMPLKTIKFTVKAGPNADIYINDKKVGTSNSDGDYKVSDMPFSSAIYIYGVMHSDGKTVTSDKYHLSESDDGQEVSLNYPGAVDKDDAANLISDFSNDLSSAVNDNNDFDPSDYFVDGSNNSDAQDFITWAKQQADQINDNKFNSVSIDSSVDSVVPAGDHSVVTGTFKYTFDVSDDDGDDHNHIQIFKFTANMKKEDSSLKLQTLKSAGKIKDYDKDNDDDN
ncbi:zinc-ribbon domain-containing protein [Apilactobacillus kunkeei]|uniref:TcaA 3rd/4th domain-containing protein n=1 Tax=Apilactobacillus kunkeei TaxID=148814 RepID=UPI00200B9517|nr:zinc-ribbon domain-containing protein [Apilactobacillus kunkeei]MCK8634800.1 zinc-ribbon domain-containing protein [Apilactobacillus kunkeei]